MTCLSLDVYFYQLGGCMNRRGWNVRKDDIAPGVKLGNLTILECAGRAKEGTIIWRCKCDCGTEKTIRSIHLRSGDIVSCGCKLRSPGHGNAKHGHASHYGLSGGYASWNHLRQTCKRKGLDFFSRWDDFPAFLADIGDRPSPKHRLRRIDTTIGAIPGNLRWSAPIGMASDEF